MRRVAAIASSAGVLGAGALIAAPVPVTAADCGRLNGGVLKAKGAVNSCRKARSIVEDFLKHRKPSVQGYLCKGGSTKVVCALDEKRITWKRS